MKSTVSFQAVVEADVEKKADVGGVHAEVGPLAEVRGAVRAGREQLLRAGAPLLRPTHSHHAARPSHRYTPLAPLTSHRYTSLGVAAALVLGDDVDPSCNLNWQRYRRRRDVVARQNA